MIAIKSIVIVVSAACCASFALDGMLLEAALSTALAVVAIAIPDTRVNR